MINFLPDTIKTFSENSQKTIGSLIADIKVDKTQIAELVKNLADFSAGPTFVPTLSISRELIRSEFFVDFFRDFEIRFSRFFDASNSINTVINSITEIMLSQISKAEKSLAYYENYINNYEFISGKDDLYNFSYIENFDNNLYSNEYETQRVPYIDRGGIPFSDNGNGYVDPISSTFKIGSGINILNILDNIKEIKMISNYEQYVSSEGNLNSLFNEDESDTWSVSVKSPVVITSTIKEISKYIDYDYSYIVGAKTLVEISLIKEIEMDFLRIFPGESNGLQLLQVAVEAANAAEKIYSLNSNNPVSGYEIKKILKAPLIIKSTIDVNLSLDRVKKIILIFNQGTYTKSNNPPLINELISRSISKYIAKTQKDRKNRYSVLQDIVVEYFRKNISIDEFKRNNYSYSEYYTCKFPIYDKNHPSLIENEFNKEKNTLISIDDSDKSFKNSPLTNLVQSIVSQALGSKVNIFKNTLFKETKTAYTENRLSEITSAPSVISQNLNTLGYKGLENASDYAIPGSQFGKTLLYNNNFASVNNYEYSFTIRGIQVGKASVAKSGSKALPLAKACYISSRISVPGDVYGIKAKLNLDENAASYNSSSFDLQEANSHELSISFSENPKIENDWIPIASYDSSKINSEMLFVDSVSSSAILRFYPQPTTLKIFENQKILSTNEYTVNRFNKSIIINSFNKNSIYIASYELDNDNYSQQYVDVSLLSDVVKILGAGEKGKDGESFKRTGSENKIVLKNNPHIDNAKLKNATYSLTYGTIAASNYSGYSPVIVKLANGTYAINLTNYLEGNFEKANFYNTSEILFFQNEKNIIFNKPINQSFNVIYNHMNNYIRFRLIVRNNFPNYFSSGSVDNVIIKMKTKSPDTNIQKLLQLG
jgi:hypothetical protein